MPYAARSPSPPTSRSAAEPGTGLLLDALHAAGKRVLLPVLRADNDLDWAVYTGELVPASRGLLEPAGPLLGVTAIADADVVLVPGLAASAGGNRLGRGGGSYDRALARVGEGVPIGSSCTRTRPGSTCRPSPTTGG